MGKPFTVKMTKIILFYGIMVAMLILIILQYLNPVQLKNGTYVNPPQTIQPFEMTDQNNQVFTQGELNGHWSLLFFGFSSCPMICPGMLETLKQVDQNLPESKHLQIIFVSVDPEHDSVQRLNQYMEPFNKNFIALSGPMSDINALQKQLHVPVSINPKSHGNEMILINPQAQVQAYFKYPITSQELSVDLNKVIDK